MELCDLMLTALADLLARREVSAVEVLESHLARIRDRNGTLNAVVSLDDGGALERARASDQCAANRGPLHGIPMTLKDAHEVAGLRTTIGTAELDRVASHDGAVASRLRAAGANIIGHTNVPAWLADLQSDNPVFGRTSNPWDQARTPGGSSGGAAAAVATGMTPGEVGSDLAGSIRQPASFCGIYGLKTTEHRVPLSGFFSLPGRAPRMVRVLSCLGPMARSLDDIELLLSIISGPDALDSDVPPVPLTAEPPKPWREWRIAVATQIPGAPVARSLSDTVRKVADAASDAGAQVVEVLPDISWDAQLQLFGDLLETVTSVTSSSEHKLGQYLTALHERDRLNAVWDQFFRSHDALLLPPAASVAFPHDPEGSELHIDGHKVKYHEQGFIHAPASVAGIPGLVIPAGRDPQGLPLGLQICGPRWSETSLLSLGRSLERDRITPGFQAPA